MDRGSLTLPPPSSAASAAITNHLFPLIGADFFHSLSRAPTFPRFLSLSDRESDIEESWGHAHRERPTDIQRNPPISIFIRFIYVLRSSSHFPIYRTTEERSRSSRAFRSIVLLGASLIYSNESNNDRPNERANVIRPRYDDANLYTTSASSRTPLFFYVLQPEPSIHTYIIDFP